MGDDDIVLVVLPFGGKGMYDGQQTLVQADGMAQSALRQGFVIEKKDPDAVQIGGIVRGMAERPVAEFQAPPDVRQIVAVVLRWLGREYLDFTAKTDNCRLAGGDVKFLTFPAQEVTDVGKDPNVKGADVSIDKGC